MCALPKVRKSRSRTRHRKSSVMKFSASAICLCSHCGQPKIPHRVCPNCGYYADKQIIAKEK